MFRDAEGISAKTEAAKRVHGGSGDVWPLHMLCKTLHNLALADLSAFDFYPTYALSVELQVLKHAMLSPLQILCLEPPPPTPQSLFPCPHTQAYISNTMC